MTFTMEQFEPSGGMEMDLSGLLGDDEVYEPPAWVTALENILYYVVTIALITFPGKLPVPQTKVPSDESASAPWSAEVQFHRLALPAH